MKWGRWVLLLPAVVALALLLPRMMDAHFGLLDDAVTIVNSRDLTREPALLLSFGRDVGRFFPVYYIYYLLVWAVSGENPAVFYAINLLTLAGTALLLVWAARLRGGTLWQAALTGTLFIVNLPVSSTFNTLSKAEVPQCLFLAGALAAGSAAGGAAGRFAVTGLLLILAILSKETGYAVVPAAGAALLFQVLRHGGLRKNWRSRQGLFFLASVTAAAVSYAAWKVIQPGAAAAGSYASHYHVDPVQMMRTLWVGILYGVRSWAYLAAPLACVPLLWKRLDETTRTAFLEGLSWAACFLLILTPWPGLFEYHLAPAALGVALAGGFALPALWGAARTAGKWRRLATAAVIVAAVLLPLHISTILSDQRIQIAMDRANFKLVEELSRLPKDSRIYFNMPPHEYVYEAKTYLHRMFGRKDLTVANFEYDHRAIQQQQAGPYYVVTGITDGVRGVLGRTGLRDLESKAWNQTLARFFGQRSEAKEAARIEEHTAGEDFAFQRAFCEGTTWPTGVCEEPRPFHLSRRITWGWTIYRVAQEPSEKAAPARMTGDGRWEFFQGSGVARTLRFGKAGDIALKGDFDGDGRDEIGVYRSSDGTFRLDLNMDGREEVTFQLEGMKPGDVPLAGDWDGDGKATAGYFRPQNSTWHLFNRNGPGVGDVWVNNFGGAGDVPLAGDWSRSGRTSVGFYRPQTGETYLRWAGLDSQETVGMLLEAEGVPVAGDWNGMGYDTFALARKGSWKARLANSPAAPFGPAQPMALPTEGYLFAGRWKKVG
jgi:hypothetical protein